MSSPQKWDRIWSPLSEVTLDDLDREIWRNLSRTVPFEGRSLLELGCGRGVQSRFMLDAGAASATLVDMSAEALRLAERLFTGFDNVHFVQGDLLDYRADHPFDIVLSSGTVEHFRGEQLLQCLRVHRDHARRLVVIVVPTTPHYNEIQCRTRRFRSALGYERPISARRMRDLLLAVGLRPLLLRRFFPLYNARAYWSLPRTGAGRVDRWLDRKFAKLDQWGERRQVRQRLTVPLRRLDRIFGGLLLAVAAPLGQAPR